MTCEERNHLKCHDKYFTAAADATAAAEAEVVFLAANIGGTLLCGKEPREAETGGRKEGKKERHTWHCQRREGGRQADMRAVQCLIHASAVSDSVSAASSAKVIAKLRGGLSGSDCGCGRRSRNESRS